MAGTSGGRLVQSSHLKEKSGLQKLVGKAAGRTLSLPLPHVCSCPSLRAPAAPAGVGLWDGADSGVREASLGAALWLGSCLELRTSSLVLSYTVGCLCLVSSGTCLVPRACLALPGSPSQHPCPWGRGRALTPGSRFAGPGRAAAPAEPHCGPGMRPRANCPPPPIRSGRERNRLWQSIFSGPSLTLNVRITACTTKRLWDALLPSTHAKTRLKYLGQMPFKF